MSDFTRFMKQNKIQRKNEFYAPTKSLTDENGKPLEWEFRFVDSREADEIRDECTKDIPIPGKPGAFRPHIDTKKLNVELIIAATVVPDLNNKELQDSYGVMKPDDLLYAMVDSPGEFSDLVSWVVNFLGYSTGMNDMVDTAKK